MASSISRRWASTAATIPIKSHRRIVIVGAGFVGSYVAKALIADSRNKIVLASRHPEALHSSLKHLGSQLLSPLSIDITKPSTLTPAFKDADCIISLVGILTGTEKQFVGLQEKGGENVALAAKEAGVGRVVMVSAIGASEHGLTPYQRTKAKAENAILRAHPTATIIRPSLVFGPGDSFYTRFATLAKYLPFLPVFGGGKSLFQPIYVGDLARAVEICSRDDEEVVRRVGGKIVEGGGPTIYTYREIMATVLKYTHLSSRRLIISLPFWLGQIQGFFLERLPESIFTVTRDQVIQLKADNIESPPSPSSTQSRLTVKELLARYPPPGISAGPPVDIEKALQDPKSCLKSVEEVLPLYIGVDLTAERENGKRKHGRGGGQGLEEVKRMSQGFKQGAGCR